MTIREILLMGNPALLQRAEPVTDPRASEIARLAMDMRDTLESIRGIGLAAPQIGVPLRVVVYCLPADRIPAGARTRPIPWTTMINPAVEPIGDDQVHLWERCLSLPGLYAKVPRFNRIRIRYQAPSGESVEQDCSGYHATLLQHECDHLEGTLYPMKLSSMQDLAYASEVCAGGTVYRYTPAEFDGIETPATIR